MKEKEFPRDLEFERIFEIKEFDGELDKPLNINEINDEKIDLNHVKFKKKQVRYYIGTYRKKKIKKSFMKKEERGVSIVNRNRFKIKSIQKK